MNNSFDWDKAIEDWQSQAPDVPEVTKNMRWLAWRMKIILLLDVVSLLVLLPFTYFIFITEPDLSIKVWFSLICVLAIVGVYFDFYLRKDLWQIPNSTNDTFLHLIKRAEAGIKLARFAVIYLAVFLLSLLGWASFKWMTEPNKMTDAYAWLSLIVGALIIVVSIAVSIWYGKKQEKELIRATQNYQDFINS